MLLRTRVGLGQHSGGAPAHTWLGEGGSRQRPRNPFEPDALRHCLSEAAREGQQLAPGSDSAPGASLDAEQGAQQSESDATIGNAVGDALQRTWHTSAEVSSALNGP